MANRKLQTEIDRVLKKVSEGVETFEEIFDKIQTATNANQKEKFEADLKKEIKKLQRLRDQIRTWIASNEIKDKSQLTENRKLIEQQMEKFKACEKEMKTKAYSKEGLLQMAKLDPKEKEKVDCCAWITQSVEDLGLQIETLEAEMETLQIAARKGRKDNSKMERLAEIDHLIERHKWHTSRLELILRLLENDRIPVDRVTPLQEDVRYYVESNQEDDFIEDEDIYNDLELEEEEALYGIMNDEYAGSKDDSATDDSRTTKERAKDEAGAESISPHKRVKEPEELTPPAQPAKISKQPPAPQRKTSMPIPQSPAKTALPIQRAAIMPKPTSQQEPVPSQQPQQLYSTPSATSPPAFHSIPSAALPTSPKSESATREKVSVPTTESEEVDSRQAMSPASRDLTASPVGDLHEQPSDDQAGKQESALSPAEDSRESPAAEIETKLPPSLKDLVAPFEATKEQSQQHRDDREFLHAMLETSLACLPDLLDMERPRHYIPRNPYPTPAHYPQQPLPHHPALFERLDIDTIFFIFYYQAGTYQQYLAARELKRQSWRFHKKYLTWFQRHEEPRAITDEYEEGTYIYFDYEGAWCQRKKSEFRFEYRYLEDTELV
ncbi:uncharacterized protein VTP21DRAFT_5196 [Calcarisporiella thermophila]|uniref:uncharacterized protein n=1 Tax=Calcarisporiella thermophila TaxID=911321 RepID=UPI0037422C8F